MNKLPALKYGAMLVAGIIAGMLFRVGLIVSIFLLLLCILSLTIFKEPKIRLIIYAICIIATGILRVSLAEDSYKFVHDKNFHCDSLNVTVIKQKTNPFYIESYLVKCNIAGYKVKATLYNKKGMPVLRPGKSYRISDVDCNAVSGSKNPYTFDYLTYAKVHGISHSLRLKKTAVFEEIKISEPIIFLAYRVRNDLSVRFLSVLGIEKGSLVNGLLLGMKSEIPTCLADLFRDLGVSHLLAVSGLHVGLIMLIVYQILLSLSVPRLPRVFTIAVFLIFYCFLTGGSPSVIRSSLMSVMVLFAPVFQRKYNALNAVAASAVILLLVNPFSLLDLGFQFSYSAVFGILIAYPRIKRLFVSKQQGIVFRYITDMLAVSLSAALFTSPVAIYYFNSLQLASMLLNIIVIPLTFCVMICAMLCLPGLYIHNIMSDMILHALDISLDIFRTVLRLASRSEIWTVHISSYWKPLILALILCTLIYVCVDGKQKRVTAILLCLTCCGVWLYISTQPELVHPELKKGDMIMLRKRRKALLVNTGWQYFNYNDYERVIRPVLEHWGSRELMLVLGDRSNVNNSIIGRLQRDYPTCKIFAPDSLGELEKEFISIDSDSCLDLAGEIIHVFPVNKMLFTEFTIKKTHFKYDNDSLSVNRKGNSMIHIKLSGIKLIQRE